jgi:hypothetical protein
LEQVARIRAASALTVASWLPDGAATSPIFYTFANSDWSVKLQYNAQRILSCNKGAELSTEK